MRPMFLAILCLIATALIPSNFARAADIKISKSKDGDPFIIITGDIVSGDVEKFRLTILQNDKADVVFLSSNGGSTLAAINIGKMIRLKEMSTAVLHNNPCVSACGLIWLGGTSRYLSGNARIGFHATYTDKNGKKIESGMGNALVGRYLTLLNMSERAVAYMTAATPDRLNWITAENSKTYGVELKSLSNDDDNDNDDDDTTNSAQINTANKDILWKTVGDWDVFIDRSNNNTCYITALYESDITLRMGTSDTEGADSYMLLSSKDWKSLTPREQYELRVEFDAMGPWTVSTTARGIGGNIALQLDHDEIKFWEEFIAANAMRIWFEEKLVAALNLKGSSNAVVAMLQCRKEQRERIQRASQNKQKDPFRR